MRLATWTTVLGFLSPLAAGAADPCIAATAACTEMIGLPGTQGRVVVYRTHALGEKNAAIRRALIVIHGLSRDFPGYYRSALAGAFLADALGDTLIIVPRLASNAGGSCNDTLAPGELSWRCPPRTDSWRTGGLSTDGSANSFDVVDELMRKLDRKEVFPNLRSIVVFGHSAGGQYVNRYEMANTVHESLTVKPTYIVSDPSSYAYLDELRPTATVFAANVAALAPGYHEALPSDPPPAFAPYRDRRNCATYDTWPYGMHERNGYAAKLTEEQLKKQLAARPVTYLIGEIDILPLGGFDSSCAAMAQGETRFARAVAYARYVSERYGAKHALVVVPLCGHNARCMLTAETSLPLLFQR